MIEADRGGKDVLVARTGILLGGAMTARLGNGLTSFDDSSVAISSTVDVLTVEVASLFDN